MARDRRPLFHFLLSFSFTSKCAPLVPDTVLCPGAIGVWQKFMDSRIDDTLALPVSEIEQKEPANRSFVEKLAVQGLSRQEIKSQLLAIFLAAKVRVQGTRIFKEES